MDSNNSNDADQNEIPGRFVRPPGYVDENYESDLFGRMNSTISPFGMTFGGQGSRPGSLKFPKMQEKENAKERQKEWQEYHDLIEAYFRMSPHVTSDIEKLDLLTLNGGPTIRNALRDVDRKQSIDFESVLALLEKKFDAGITAQGYLVEFWNTKQKPGEGFIDFVRRLEELAHDAKMGDDKDQSIILQALKGAKNAKRLNDPLIYYGKTLEEIKHLATQLEIDDDKNSPKTSASFKKEEEENSADVHFVNRSKSFNQGRSSSSNWRSRYGGRRNRGGQSNQNYTRFGRQGNSSGYKANQSQNDDKSTLICYNCKKPGHMRRNCRAYQVERDNDEKVEVLGD